MVVLILAAIALVVFGALAYVLTLDFEIGDGFTEEKRKAREATYIEKEATVEKKRLK